MIKKKILLSCTAAIASSLALAGIGCEADVHTHPAYDHDDHAEVVHREVIVEQAPPPARAEAVREERPGYVWVPGYYRHDGREYVWVEGRYERPPHEGAHWEAGRWDHRGNGYVWIEGHWH